jgi:hypothetical protein
MRVVICILLVLLFGASFAQEKSLEDKAIFLYNSGKTVQAIELLESIDSERALRLLIDYLTWENVADRALEKIEVYEKKYGYSPEVEFRKAQLLAWNGKTTESRKLLKRLLKERVSFFPDIVELIGFTYLWEGRKEEAEFYLSWAYDLGKREPELLKALARLSDDTQTVSSSRAGKEKIMVTNLTEQAEKSYPEHTYESAYLKEEKSGVEFDVVLKGNSYYFSDSSGSRLLLGTLGAEVEINRFVLGVEGGGYQLSGEKGAIYGVYGKVGFNPLQVEGGIRVYEGLKETKFRKYNPFLKVRVEGNNYVASVGYEKLLFGVYARSRKSYRREMEADKYSLTTSVNLFGRNLWSDISVLDIDDKNLMVIPQFSCDLYYFNRGRFSITPFIAGYYVFSKEQREIYYSPEFHDEELLGVDFRYRLTDNFYVSLKPSGGYSFKDNVYIYSTEGKVGLDYDRGSVSLFVNHSNSAGKFSTYNYNEVGLKGLIRW